PILRGQNYTETDKYCEHRDRINCVRGVKSQLEAAQAENERLKQRIEELKAAQNLGIHAAARLDERKKIAEKIRDYFSGYGKPFSWNGAEIAKMIEREFIDKENGNADRNS